MRCPTYCIGVIASVTTGRTTWYVDAANCPGPGNGSLKDPFCPIQNAIDAAVDGVETLTETVP